MKGKIKTRVVRKHMKGCTAMRSVKEGNWKTPWYFPAGYRQIPGTVNRDSIGRKTSGMGQPWLVFKCNCARTQDCPAEILVCLEDIFNQIPTQ